MKEVDFRYGQLETKRTATKVKFGGNITGSSKRIKQALASSHTTILLIM
jgi:hypothetical protein